MSTGKKVTLNTGAEIPQLGYGTWQSSPGEVGASVYEALKIGYRHLDFAKIYQNQREIGESLKKAFHEIPGLKREDVFITSKLWNNKHHAEDVAAALDDCLNELQLDYLDLYLIHWPVAFTKGDNLFPLVEGKNLPDGDVELDDSVSIVETWKAMTELPKSKARAVGVSNFTVEHLEAVINATGVVPAANQVERHPLLPNSDLIEYCTKKNIHITGYSPLGNNAFNEPLLIKRPEIIAVAEKLGASPAQVILAWSQVGGHSVIPKSVTASRIKENFQEVELAADDIAAVAAIGSAPRRYNIPYIANKPRWDIDCFNDVSEKSATHQVIV